MGPRSGERSCGRSVRGVDFVGGGYLNTRQARARSIASVRRVRVISDDCVAVGQVAAEVTERIFERLGFGDQSWEDGMDKHRGERLLGRIFAANRIKLRGKSPNTLARGTLTT
jgi:hypothetical protein